MFDASNLSPAQQRAVREIGDFEVRFTTDPLYPSSKAAEWGFYRECSKDTFEALIRNGAVALVGYGVWDDTIEKYRLTPEALAWAKEQANADS